MHKLNLHRHFSLMELILALFIMAGACTTLLIERQRSLQQRVSGLEKQQILQHLHNALDTAEAMGDLDDSMDEDIISSIDLQSETQSIPELGIELEKWTATWTTEHGISTSLERWVKP